MKRVSSLEMATLLNERAQAAPLGLLFDYDGTLAEIAPSPDLALIRDATLQPLLRLSSRPRVKVALITGRSRESLVKVVGPLPGITLATNGGMLINNGERHWEHPQARQLKGTLRGLCTQLSTDLRRWPGRGGGRP